MTELADAIPFLVHRAEELAAVMLGYALDRRVASPRPPAARRRALQVYARCRALAAAMSLAEGDDVLTAATELTVLEEAADELLGNEQDTVRPPPSASGTFVVERKKASTNRLLAVRGDPPPNAS